ncbi:MAG: hypothetical protein MK364_13315, partial [Pirellulales bacterium]|nr:hypothetical protein [Pirellulales bacterium]
MPIILFSDYECRICCQAANYRGGIRAGWDIRCCRQSIGFAHIRVAQIGSAAHDQDIRSESALRRLFTK